MTDPLRLLASVATSAGRPYALESELIGAGLSRETLGELLWGGLADCLESTGEGDYLPEGVWWTLSIKGATEAGLALFEREDDKARWEDARAVECELWGPEAGEKDVDLQVPIRMPELEKRKRIDVTLGWVEEQRWYRAEERRLAAEAAREKIDAALAEKCKNGRQKSHRSTKKRRGKRQASKG